MKMKNNNISNKNGGHQTVKIFLMIFSMMIIFSSFVVAQSPFYYDITLEYNEGAIEVKSYSIGFSEKEIDNLYYGPYHKLTYNSKVLDINGITLEEIPFTIPNVVFYDNYDNVTGELSGGVREVNQVEFVIKIPYYENAKEIVIYDGNDNELIRKDISLYSKERIVETEPVESGGGIFIEDSKDSQIIIYILIGIVIVIALILFIIMRSKK